MMGKRQKEAIGASTRVRDDSDVGSAGDTTVGSLDDVASVSSSGAYILEVKAMEVGGGVHAGTDEKCEELVCGQLVGAARGTADCEHFDLTSDGGDEVFLDAGSAGDTIISSVKVGRSDLCSEVGDAPIVSNGHVEHSRWADLEDTASDGVDGADYVEKASKREFRFAQGLALAFPVWRPPIHNASMSWLPKELLHAEFHVAKPKELPQEL
jgi:hypothetical protein